MPTCPVCGATTPKDASFCGKCGNKLDESGDRTVESEDKENAETDLPSIQPDHHDDSGGKPPSSRQPEGGHEPSQQRSAGSQGGREAGIVAGFSLSNGATAGFRTFLYGYLLVGAGQILEFIVLMQRLGVSLEDLIRAFEQSAGAGSSASSAESLVVLVKMIGWVFFNAHQVPIVSSSGGRSESVNLIAQMGQSSVNAIPPITYYVIPPILLAIAGYKVASATETSTAMSGVIPGASVAIGYVPMALVGAVFVQFSYTVFRTSISVGPALGAAAVFTGVWAVVFGGAGGLISGAFTTAGKQTG